MFTLIVITFSRTKTSDIEHQAISIVPVDDVNAIPATEIVNSIVCDEDVAEDDDGDIDISMLDDANSWTAMRREPTILACFNFPLNWRCKGAEGSGQQNHSGRFGNGGGYLVGLRDISKAMARFILEIEPEIAQHHLLTR